MGLLSILKKLKEKEREMRVLILGLDNAGKTTILKKFNGEDIDEISPTLGFSIKTLEYKGFKLNVWDVGGQSTIRSYWRNYFEQTDAIVWVVDSSDKRRLGIAKAELEKVLKQEKLAGATLLVFANKQDLSGALSSTEIATQLGLIAPKDKTTTTDGGSANTGSASTEEGLSGLLAETRHWQIHPCSAVTGEGLEHGVRWLVSDVASRIFLVD